MGLEHRGHAIYPCGSGRLGDLGDRCQAEASALARPRPFMEREEIATEMELPEAEAYANHSAEQESDEGAVASPERAEQGLVGAWPTPCAI